MKKLLLVSMLQNVMHILRTVEPELKNKTVTYIPTACNAEKLKFIFKLRKFSFKSMGLMIDELDISSSSYETIQAKLAKNDIIFVAGGNTFYLLQEMKRTGADKLIADQVNKGKLYIGESAGAIIAAPDIEYASAMDSREAAPDLKEYSGLGLIDFYVVPHSQNRGFSKAVKQIISTYSSTLDLPSFDKSTYGFAATECDSAALLSIGVRPVRLIPVPCKIAFCSCKTPQDPGHRILVAGKAADGGVLDVRRLTLTQPAAKIRSPGRICPCQMRVRVIRDSQAILMKDNTVEILGK